MRSSASALAHVCLGSPSSRWAAPCSAAPAAAKAKFEPTPGLFDEPEPIVSAVTDKAYDCVLTWEAFDAWHAKLQAAEFSVGIEGATDASEYDGTALFSGDRVVTMPSGWDERCHVYIEHDDPVPFTVLAVIPELNVTG